MVWILFLVRLKLVVRVCIYGGLKLLVCRCGSVCFSSRCLCFGGVWL